MWFGLKPSPSQRLKGVSASSGRPAQAEVGHGLLLFLRMGQESMGWSMADRVHDDHTMRVVDHTRGLRRIESTRPPITWPMVLQIHGGGSASRI